MQARTRQRLQLGRVSPPRALTSIPSRTPPTALTPIGRAERGVNAARTRLPDGQVWVSDHLNRARSGVPAVPFGRCAQSCPVLAPPIYYRTRGITKPNPRFPFRLGLTSSLVCTGLGASFSPQIDRSSGGLTQGCVHALDADSLGSRIQPGTGWGVGDRYRNFLRLNQSD